MGKIVDGGRYAYEWWPISRRGAVRVVDGRARAGHQAAHGAHTTGTARLKAKVLLDLPEAGFIVHSPTAAADAVARVPDEGGLGRRVQTRMLTLLAGMESGGDGTVSAV